MTQKVPASDRAAANEATDRDAGPAQANATPPRTAPSGSRKLVTWLVLCLTVILLGWLVYRAPMGREMIVRSAAMLGPRSVPLLRRALTDDEQQVKRAAAESLTELGAAAVPGLTAELQDPDPRVRAWSAFGLSVLGVQGKDAVSALLPVTEDPDPKVRRNALMALCAVNAYGEVARPVVRKALQDADPEVRGYAGEAMGRFARETPAAAKDASEAVQPQPAAKPGDGG
jgi:HEAT repeat protein